MTITAVAPTLQSNAVPPCPVWCDHNEPHDPDWPLHERELFSTVVGGTAVSAFRRRWDGNGRIGAEEIRLRLIDDAYQHIGVTLTAAQRHALAAALTHDMPGGSVPTGRVLT